jgi:hypothetical protein
MTFFRVLLSVLLAAAFLTGGCRPNTPRPRRPTPSATVDSTPSPEATPSPTPSVAGAASPEVDVIFSRPFFALDFAGCDAEGSGFACSYETETEELKMTITGTAANGHTVETVTFLTT